MKARIQNLFLTFAALLMLYAAAFAQTAGSGESARSAGSAPAASSGTARARASMPFAVGEKLTYEGKLSRVITDSVADLVMTVREAEQSDDFLIEAEARSKGTLLKIFRFSFLQRVHSTIDNDKFIAMRTVKHDVQKERIRNSEADFDYSERRVTYTEVDPNEPMRPPRRIASDLTSATHDILSGVYYLRMLPMAIGKVYDLSVSDSGLVYTIPVRVVAREQLKTVFGRVWCYRVEPEVFGPGRFIEQEGYMKIWLTDDARRIPVRSVVKSSIGKLDIRLRAADGLK